MSEFSASYHLRSNSLQEGIELVKRARFPGFVLPPTTGWVTIVVDSFDLLPQMVSANQGLLISYAYGEDHGWAVSVLLNQQVVSHYECWWGQDGIEIDADEFDPERPDELEFASEIKINADELHLERLNEIARKNGIAELTAEQVNEIFYPTDFGKMFESPPAYQFADWLGLPEYKWLSLHYVELDRERGDGRENAIWVDA